MVLLLLKKITLLFLLVSASFLSTFSGRPSMLLNGLPDGEVDEELSSKALDNNEMGTIHERLLRANTHDYGKYDPAPALVKPPFKLIPN
uniref:Uncharacterized protein MANES_11G091700 n=2 Tax=Rhizophora mucronata TaxID=61149 RepID=A0A2P2IME2_RHIMU